MNRLAFWFGVGFALGPLLLPGWALADAISMPPSRCPPGAIPRSSHVGQYCSPSICLGNSDCEGGEVCAEQPLCVEQMSGYSRGGPMTVDNAVTTCTADGDCPPNTVCLTEMRCVSRTSALGGDGITIPTAGLAVAIAVVLLLIVVLIGVLGIAVIVLRKKKSRARRG